MNTNNFPTEAIILAGGKGTRLREVVKDIPKPMAMVNGKPFLYHLLNFLAKQNIKHFILSVGYKYKVIEDYFGNEFKGIKITYAIEKKPLGTGGAIKLASGYAKNDKFWIVNGDTFVDIDLHSFYHHCNINDISLALVEMQNFDRYGAVETDSDRIIAFHEKKYTRKGLINAGVYLISKYFINQYSPDKNAFSFETDILEKYVDKTKIGYFTTKSIFVDIGIPEDYYRSQKLFSIKLNKNLLFSLDSSWTIFLDRDGVINRRKPGSYIKNIRQFEFIDGAKKAIAKLGKKFTKIIVITNQQGLGKGLMTIDELNTVNNYMVNEITKAGGRIDGIYFCPELTTDKNNCRKPAPSMAFKAKKDFPSIDFHKSIIFGDSISDIQFGKNLDMMTVLIPSKPEEKNLYPKIEVDWRIDKLGDII